MNKKGEDAQRVPTSAEEFQAKAQGEVVELPGFDDEPVYMRIRRPSMAHLIRTGKIPNELMSVAEKAYQGVEDLEEVDFAQLIELLYLFAESAVVEPPFEEIKDLLTDSQLLAIYSYVQRGVRALESFRGEQGGGPEPGLDGRDLGAAAQRNAGAG